MREQIKLRWFSFSLKTLLVVMTALAVWLGFYVKSFRDRRAAVAAIEQFDGAMGIKYLGPDWLRKFVDDEKYFWDPAGVHFNTTYHITDDDLQQVMRHLTGFKRLHDLTLQGSAITDDGVAMLLPLSDKLVYLDLAGTKTTDLGVKHLKKFRYLTTLDISNTAVTLAGYEELRKALPSCNLK